MPAPLGGSMSKSMRQMPPFLNASGALRADQLRRELAEVRLVPDERDPRPCATCFVISWTTAAGVPAGASASEVDDGGFVSSSSANTSAVCRVRTSGLVTI